MCFMHTTGCNRLYFNKYKYSVSLDSNNRNSFRRKAYTKLCKDLTKAADKNSSLVLSNGRKTAGYCAYCCACAYRQYKLDKQKRKELEKLGINF